MLEFGVGFFSLFSGVLVELMGFFPRFSWLLSFLYFRFPLVVRADFEHSDLTFDFKRNVSLEVWLFAV